MKFECKSRGIHIAHINIRSLNKKMELIKATFQDSNATIVTMCETWLTSKYSEAYNAIEGYVVIRQDREWDLNKKGGGICTYLKNGLNYSEFKYKHLNQNCQNLECQWISIKQNIGKEIIIVNCYRPPQGDITECLRHIEEGIYEVYLNKADLFIIGDLNMNVLDKKDKNVQSFNNSLRQKGFLQLIKEPTRITALTATCIDLCYMEYAGLEISVNSRIASSFSRQIANVNAGPVLALESMAPKRSFRCHSLNICLMYKQSARKRFV